MFDQVADYLNNIEETACDMSNRELIGTLLWTEHILTTSSGKHQEGCSVTKAKGCTLHHFSCNAPLRLGEEVLQRSHSVGEALMASQDRAWRCTGSEGTE